MTKIITPHWCEGYNPAVLQYHGSARKASIFPLCYIQITVCVQVVVRNSIQPNSIIYVRFEDPPFRDEFINISGSAVVPPLGSHSFILQQSAIAATNNKPSTPQRSIVTDTNNKPFILQPFIPQQSVIMAAKKNACSFQKGSS